MKQPSSKTITTILIISGTIIILSGITLFLTTCCISQDKTKLIPLKPLVCFENADLTINSNKALTPLRAYKTTNSKLRFYKHGIIVRLISTHKIKKQDQDIWVSENMFFARNNSKGKATWTKVYRFGHNLKILPWCLVFLGMSLLSLTIITKKQQRYSLLFTLTTCSLFYITGILTFFYFNGIFIIDTGDQRIAIKKAIEWTTMGSHTHLAYQAPGALLYLPLLEFFNTRNYWDIAIPRAICNVVIAIMNIGIGLMIIKRITRSEASLYIYAIFSTLFPVTALIMSKGGASDIFGIIGKTGLYYGHVNPYSVTLLNRAILMGWNGYPGLIAVLFVQLGILQLFSRKNSIKKYILLGSCLGIAISFRYGSLVILPAIFYLDLARNHKKKTHWKILLLHYSVFAIFGVIGMGIQLLDNYLINGSPFHPTAAKRLFNNGEHIINLFSINNTLNGCEFFMTIHYKTFLLMVVFLFAILKSKLSLFFWFWFMTALLFYSSLNFYIHSDVRYILVLFPCVYTLIAFALSKSNIQTIFTISSVIILNYTLVSPESPFAYSPLCMLPLYAHYIIPIISALVLWSLSKFSFINKYYGYTAALYCILLACGQWWIILLLALVFPVLFIIQNMIKIPCKIVER